MGLTIGRRTLLAVVSAVAVASIYVAQPILVQIGGELGIPAGSLGWVVTAGQAGYVLGLVALVPLGDLVDRRRLITLHLVLAGGGMALAATAVNSSGLLIAMALAGCFAVVVQIAVAYAAALSEPEKRGRNLGVVTSGVVVGILGGRVLAGALAGTHGWRSVYIVLAAALCVLGLLAWRLLPPDPRTGSITYRQVLGSTRQLFREPLFLSRGIIAFFLFASFGTLWTGVALPLAAAPWHLDSGQIGLFGLVGLAGAFGARRAGRWLDAGLAVPITGGALVLLVLSWLVLGQAGWSLWVLAAGIVALDFAVQTVHVSNQHLLTAAYPGRTSTVIGAYMICYSLGSAGGAIATTAVYAAAGWTGSCILGGIFAACALFTWSTGRALPGPSRGPDPSGGEPVQADRHAPEAYRRRV